MTEQGQFAYFLKRDAQSLARLLLNREAQKLGANYVLISSLTQIGQPVVAGNDNGSIAIKIGAAGDAQYQFPSAQLHRIQISIKNMKLKDAITFIKRQPGVDPNTVAVHLSAGDTMPGDTQQIKIIPVNPINIPAVQLPAVSSNTTPNNNNSSTVTPTSGASPTVTPTEEQ